MHCRKERKIELRKSGKIFKAAAKAAELIAGCAVFAVVSIIVFTVLSEKTLR